MNGIDSWIKEVILRGILSSKYFFIMDAYGRNGRFRTETLVRVSKNCLATKGPSNPLFSLTLYLGDWGRQFCFQSSFGSSNSRQFTCNTLFAILSCPQLPTSNLVNHHPAATSYTFWSFAVSWQFLLVYTNCFLCQCQTGGMQNSFEMLAYSIAAV